VRTAISVGGSGKLLLQGLRDQARTSCVGWNVCEVAGQSWTDRCTQAAFAWHGWRAPMHQTWASPPS